MALLMASLIAELISFVFTALIGHLFGLPDIKEAHHLNCA